MENENIEKKSNFWKEFFRTIKYFIVAGSAALIQIGTFTLFLEVFHWVEWLAYLISLILSVLWNFTINRKVTFKSANNIPIAMLKVALYYAVFTPLSTWWTDALNAAGWNAYVVEIGTILINGITEFLYQRFFVFGKSIDTATKKTEN